MFNIKTIIELHDKCQLENIMAGLSFMPEKIIFVGFDETMSDENKQDLEEFLKACGANVKIEYEMVDRNALHLIVDKLNKIIDMNNDCCFDLTGGMELVLVAMGIVATQRNIPMLQFDIENASLIRVNNCHDIFNPRIPKLSVKESVMLNGGRVLKDEFEWHFDDEFAADVEKLWKICCNNCKRWNRQANAFSVFCEYGSTGNDVDINLRFLKDRGEDTFIDEDILMLLEEGGYIYDYEYAYPKISFRYKSDQIRRCLTKAGNILELYAYMTAHEINKSFNGYFTDIDMGVTIDWDGEIHGEYDGEVDTTNEIDIFLTRGVVPVFISCKNGTVHKEDLYELSIVAEKIGGKYAKKILLCTYMTSDFNSKKYLLKRAEDMGIVVIEKVDKTQKSVFMQALIDATKYKSEEKIECCNK